MKNKITWLKLSENRRFLLHEDDTPFFWLGDTAWELFHKLNKEEAAMYLENRSERQFNVIQAVALAELEGVTTGNAYGRLPLKLNSEGKVDPRVPDLEGEYSYWDHVDYIMKTAESLGLYIAFLPTWGDKYHQAWGKGPEIFNKENARDYGEWLGRRYQDQANIIWVLGGDRSLNTRFHQDIIHAMAEGIRAGDGGRHLMTFHPTGRRSSSFHVHEEDWLDFNMIQSGHNDVHQSNFRFVEEDYRRIPTKPVLDGEPCYEDHPKDFKAENGYFDQTDVRQAAYYAVFAGAFGHTYGHHSIWSMTTEPADYFIMTWRDAMLRPGAAQMQHLRALMESRPFVERIPDQSLICENYTGLNCMTATRGDTYAMIYFPNGLKGEIQLGILRGDKLTAKWFDPRTGSYSEKEFIMDNKGTKTFIPPASGRGNDWVLVLDTLQ